MPQRQVEPLSSGGNWFTGRVTELSPTRWLSELGQLSSMSYFHGGFAPVNEATTFLNVWNIHIFTRAGLTLFDHEPRPTAISGLYICMYFNPWVWLVLAWCPSGWDIVDPLSAGVGSGYSFYPRSGVPGSRARTGVFVRAAVLARGQAARPAARPPPPTPPFVPPDHLGASVAGVRHLARQPPDLPTTRAFKLSGAGQAGPCLSNTMGLRSAMT